MNVIAKNGHELFAIGHFEATILTALAVIPRTML
jgi:hypothetical protein